jgi:hypothetical protein
MTSRVANDVHPLQLSPALSRMLVAVGGPFHFALDIVRIAG